jgi:AraC family transcriptional regulator
MVRREELLRKEYEARINRAIDFVYANYSRDFDFGEMADAANFSRFHFHRLFLAFTGETPAEFTRRYRLARAAGFLGSAPGLGVTEIALACGFSGSSAFARAFKDRYGVSASEWRDGKRAVARDSNGGEVGGKGSETVGNGGDAPGKGGKAHAGAGGYHDGIDHSERRNVMERLEYKIEVKELPAMTVAYARHLGPYGAINEAFERLFKWAGPRGLVAADTKVLATFHDDTDVTPEDKLRSDACITVPAGTEVGADIGLKTIPGGKFAVGHFELRSDQFGQAWNAIMGEWMPSSGYQPDDRMCYELYLNDHTEHPEGKFIVDICEPVKPL